MLRGWRRGSRASGSAGPSCRAVRRVCRCARLPARGPLTVGRTQAPQRAQRVTCPLRRLDSVPTCVRGRVETALLLGDGRTTAEAWHVGRGPLRAAQSALRALRRPATAPPSPRGACEAAIAIVGHCEHCSRKRSCRPWLTARARGRPGTSALQLLRSLQSLAGSSVQCLLTSVGLPPLLGDSDPSSALSLPGRRGSVCGRSVRTLLVGGLQEPASPGGGL